jgi:hypothetical protein
MRVRLATLATFLAISAALAQGWPALPASGFISGRAANDKDIADGNAIFALRSYGGPFGKPLDVVVPQYAYLKRRGQTPVPVIVVQAEEGKHIKVFGVRGFDGKASTARDTELQLLGTNPPH